MTPRQRDLLRRGLAIVAAFGSFTFLAACGDDDDTADTGSQATGTTAGAGEDAPEDPVALDVMMPFQIGTSFIADMTAVSCGFFEDEGLDVELTFAQGAPQALQQLGAGNVDIIRNGPVEMIQAIVNEDAPFISIGTVNQRTNFTLTSLPEDSYALEDLEGLTVGMPSVGGNAQASLEVALRNIDIDPATVGLQAVGSDASGYAALEEGLVDALFVARGTVAQYRAAGEDPHVDMLSDINPLLGTNLVAQTGFVEENHDVVVRYLRALHAVKMALNDEAQRRELIPCVADGGWDLPQLEDVDSASDIIAATVTQWFEEGEENLLRNVPELWDEGVGQLIEQGIVPEGTEATEFYTNDLLDEALS
jgi:NitT/TauT family transport system substrate-binding protein